MYKCEWFVFGAVALAVSVIIAKVSRTEVLRVGSTSGATVANVSNIDVFEVGANIVLLS